MSNQQNCIQLHPQLIRALLLQQQRALQKRIAADGQSCFLVNTPDAWRPAQQDRPTVSVSANDKHHLQAPVDQEKQSERKTTIERQNNHDCIPEPYYTINQVSMEDVEAIQYDLFPEDLEDLTEIYLPSTIAC
mmetsp:Transcript_41418/g.64740  ORF Transcript_41418/g.64740 Transcript_41418/m.64740 type:complete len:133 (-) Transcript_41418:121-519(-)|eukprot:CAMPEP_0194559682 /NCGR_PEP_ID=MMETSP0292-20121207/1145_1 /TAXON_ID=39354 /ORGANISM="Heterosigma akashiwo, Strain CCMP2393" /LENGTH=132 /DNA_ID=CAMNT_0039407671 /DNA_START=297 /DNA_END=695 /DNA_ORIENTATION=+